MWLAGCAIAAGRCLVTEALMHDALIRLRNHIVTGFIFIMPVLLIIAVLGKFSKQLLKIGGKCSKLLGVDTVLGPAGDAIAAVLVFLVICILAGFLIRISFLRKLSEQIDEQDRKSTRLNSSHVTTSRMPSSA